MDPHLRHSAANSSHVSEVSIFSRQQFGDDAVNRLAVPQPAQPPVERRTPQDREHGCIVRYIVQITKEIRGGTVRLGAGVQQGNRKIAVRPRGSRVRRIEPESTAWQPIDRSCPDCCRAFLTLFRAARYRIAITAEGVAQAAVVLPELHIQEDAHLWP